MVQQSNNGAEFSAEILQKLMEMIIHGHACHTQSQGSVERDNQDIETMVSTWLHDHNTDNRV
jgi:hypothetical protein